VTRYPSPRLAVYGALAALGLVAALAARRPELAALAAPFALVLALATLAGRPPQVRSWLRLTRDRALEGDEIEGVLTLRADEGADRLEAVLVLPAGIRDAGGALPASVRLHPDEDVELALRLVAARWGSYRLGDLRLRARDPVGLFSWEQRVSHPHRLLVYPRPERLARLVSPLDTQAAVGSQVARAKGEGLEPADLRPFVTGDRLRSVNWRASARRGELVVTERHPERNTDVVVFLDTFVEARRLDQSSLDRAVRAAATLASHYLARRDRVGLVSLGGTLRWLEPGAGLVQQYRLVDALLETDVVFTYAWKGANVIPARTLPSRALVLAVTPLLDSRGISALLDLRARGHDLAVVEVSPLDLVEPGPSEDDRLAYRLWRLEREELVARFALLGVAVARWDGTASLAPSLEEVRAFRRHARLALRQ
jgi:uncharacterized protein (DUF58 family)